MMMVSEKEMEDCIVASPELFLGERELTLAARQLVIDSYRFDLLFRDRHGGKLIVEIQKGTLDRTHTYKIVDYYHGYREKHPTEFIEVMIVANQIPAERKKRLHDMGIEFREIPEDRFSRVLSELRQRQEQQQQLRQEEPQQEPIVIAPRIAAEDKSEQPPKEAGGSYHFKSLGPSAFVRATRVALAKECDTGRWKLGGRSSLTAVFLPAKDFIDEFVGERGFTPQIWMERPRNGKVASKFEVAYKVPGLSDEENNALREKIANSIRTHLEGHILPANVVTATGSTVAKLQASVEGIQSELDDTPEAVARYLPEIEAMVIFFRFMDKVLTSWVSASK